MTAAEWIGWIACGGCRPPVSPALLNVNVNNPGAVAACIRLGFRYAGHRARYEPARLAAPWQPR